MLIGLLGEWLMGGLIREDFFEQGRLRDDNFRDLGYPAKFYRVQDVGFIYGFWG